MKNLVALRSDDNDVTLNNKQVNRLIAEKILFGETEVLFNEIQKLTLVVASVLFDEAEDIFIVMKGVLFAAFDSDVSFGFHRLNT